MQTHYVVIGAFAIENNAKKFSGYVRSRFFQSEYEYNADRKLYYVYVVKTEIKREALVQVKILQADEEFYDSWIFTGQLGKSSQQKYASTPESTLKQIDPLPQPVETNIIDNVIISDVQPTPDSTKTEEPKKDSVINTVNAKRIVKGKLFKFDIRSPSGEPFTGEVHHVDLRRGKDIATYSSSDYTDVPKPTESNKPMTLVCGIFGYQEITKLVDYVTPSLNEEVTQDEENAWVVPFKLERLKKGDWSVMYGVSFYKDAVAMKPTSQEDINELVSMMKSNPAYKIKVHGHVNGRRDRGIVTLGEPKKYFELESRKKIMASAKELSKLRAEAVRDYLVENGIAKSRIEIYAWGWKNMLVPEGSPSSGLNDRIEIEILKD